MPTSRPSDVVTGRLLRFCVRIRSTHGLDACAGSDGARPRSHCRFDALGGITLERVSVELADHDPIIIYDEAGVPTRVADAIAYFGDVVAEVQVGTSVRA
jgi:hypothetical protein